ncbi:MAG: hypothetical protein COA77_06790 [Thaumarchaeota archaeon]|nr:MAG: hypothetical protein COA77_06790 [Nitrososphaerota archaeon]
MGHKFSFTNSGKEAVDLIKNNSYDLVLLNLAMPNFSGYNVIGELEKKIILIILTLFCFLNIPLMMQRFGDLFKKELEELLKNQ